MTKTQAQKMVKYLEKMKEDVNQSLRMISDWSDDSDVPITVLTRMQVEIESVINFAKGSYDLDD